MARTQANVYLTIWTDPDFRGLPTDAQWLYFTMLTHESLNYCGVMDWRPARLAAMNDDMTIPRVEHAAWELGQRRMVAVDPDTEEALVRSFVRHDGVLRSPNTAKGLVREYGGIASLRLMELVSHEVRRAFDENPNWGGIGEATPVLKQFPEALADDFIWVPDRFRSPSDLPSKPLQLGLETPSILTPQKTGSPSDHPSSTSTSTSTSTEVENEGTTRETRLPKTWAPTASHIQRAKDTGLDVIVEAEKFRLHADEKARTSANWNLAFTRWLINAKEYRDRDARRRPQQTSSTTDERVAGWLALGEQMTQPTEEPDWKELTA